jgi:hypothetical protein
MCNPAMGCMYTNHPGPCDDEDACTTGDFCTSGYCTGAPDACDDADACTVDSCDSVSGCQHEPISCDDGDPCTVDSCDPQSGSCLYSPTDCNDFDPCTDDTCTPQTGCIHTNGTGPCDDGDPCTENDACAGGTCGGTPASSPPEVMNLLMHADKVAMSWTSVTGAVYDVVRGLVSGLPVGPLVEGTVDEICIGNNLPVSSAMDGAFPQPDQGFWYLVRASASCGAGTYGHQSNGTPRFTSTCP